MKIADCIISVRVAALWKKKKKRPDLQTSGPFSRLGVNGRRYVLKVCPVCAIRSRLLRYSLFRNHSTIELMFCQELFVDRSLIVWLQVGWDWLEEGLEHSN
jgi:hypothetical protein